MSNDGWEPPDLERTCPYSNPNSAESGRVRRKFGRNRTESGPCRHAHLVECRIRPELDQCWLSSLADVRLISTRLDEIPQYVGQISLGTAPSQAVSRLELAGRCAVTELLRESSKTPYFSRDLIFAILAHKHCRPSKGSSSVPLVGARFGVSVFAPLYAVRASLWLRHARASCGGARRCETAVAGHSGCLWGSAGRPPASSRNPGIGLPDTAMGHGCSPKWRGLLEAAPAHRST